jgi:transcriptional/translational regulatory protein YebC/TACO1
MNELEIHCEYSDMEAICDELKANNIEFEFNPESDNMIPRILTDDTSRAVEIINKLGYTTDEDEDDEDERGDAYEGFE